MFNSRDAQHILFLIIESSNFTAERDIGGCLVQSFDSIIIENKLREGNITCFLQTVHMVTSRTGSRNQVF